MVNDDDQAIPESLPLLDAFLDEHIPKGYQPFADCAVLLIQHQLGSLVPMSKALFKLGLKPDYAVYIDIPYTENQKVREALEELGVPHTNFDERTYNLAMPYAPYQRRRVSEVISAVRFWFGDTFRLLVMDDGSYFLDAMTCFDKFSVKIGVVEQTTRGVIKMREDLALWKRCADFPIINVAESSPKKKLESPFIGQAVTAQLAHKLKGTLELQPNDKVLILGYGDIGQRVARELTREFKIDPPNVYVGEPRRKHRAIAVQDGYQIWDRKKREGVTFKLVVGCSGRTSFTVSDRVFLENDAVLASASSGSAELSREEFIDLAESYDGDDIYVIDRETLAERDLHSDIELQVIDKKVTFLNGGFPVNFDGRINCVPPKFIQPTHTLQIGAAIQAMTTDETGLIPLNRKLCNWVTRNFQPILTEAGYELN